MRFALSKIFHGFWVALATLLAVASLSHAATPLDRLGNEVLDVVPPSARVRGTPGNITMRPSACRSAEMSDVRRRLVDVAAQEWGYFGFSVVDQTAAISGRATSRSIRRPPRLRPTESLRVADSIAGYWSVTPDGGWILERQNRVWNGPSGPTSRWRDPWSAAFISWVMCEGGLGDAGQFQRAIAHHVYIDQAIRARDDSEPNSAFAAYDVGETDVESGDLLCTARRSAYRTLAERREHLGIGARTHCDLVVKVDEVNAQILAIGGNVRGSVRLKRLPAVRSGGGPMFVADQSMIPGGRAVFAHLKLRADSIEPNALDNSPTIRALGEDSEALSRLRRATGDPATSATVAMNHQLKPVPND